MSGQPLIIQISTVADPCNGVGGIVCALDEAVRRSGYRSYVVAGRGRKDEADYIMQGRIGRWINVLRARMSDSDGFVDSRRTRRMIDHILSLKPSLVHLHNLHGYYLNAPMLVNCLKKAGIPVVLTLHDLWMLSPHCAYPDGNCNRNCPECRFLRERYPVAWRTSRYNKNLTEKSEMMSGVYVIAPSESVAERADGRVSEVIPNGVDTAVFHKSPKLPGINLLAVATRWHDIKNPSALLRVADMMPDDMKLTVVGEDGPRHRAIKNIRYLDKPELAKMMAESTALISPSHDESFGMTVLEAIACGTPAIVQACVATETLVAGGNGFAVDFNNTKDVIDAIHRCSSLTPTTSLTQNRMTDSYLKVYDSLIGAASK